MYVYRKVLIHVQKKFRFECKLWRVFVSFT